MTERYYIVIKKKYFIGESYANVCNVRERRTKSIRSVENYSMER